MCLEASYAFERHLSAVGTGRRWLSDQLHTWGAENVPPIDDVLLAASELFGNAVKFGSGADVAVALQVHRGELCVAVADDNDDHARLGAAATSDDVADLAESGRGLALVEALALRWGQDRSDGHKTVWCSFELPGGSMLSIGCP